MKERETFGIRHLDNQADGCEAKVMLTAMKGMEAQGNYEEEFYV